MAARRAGLGRGEQKIKEPHRYANSQKVSTMSDFKKKLLEITDSDIEMALERPTTSGGIRGKARKEIKIKDINAVISLELKIVVNDFLKEFPLTRREKNLLKRMIVKAINKSFEKEGLEAFREIQPQFVSILKNMLTLKTSREGKETLRSLIKLNKIEELTDASKERLDYLIDTYGPGLP